MGRGWKRVEQFLLQLGNVMEQLSLEMYYWRFDQRHFYGNADQFSELCQKLHQLRSVQLTINVQLFDELTDDTVAGFTRSFRTAYWLDGPLGRVCVAVDLHRLYKVVQINSVPYAFSGTSLIRTVDFVNVQFNTQEEHCSALDVPGLLESTWTGFERVMITFDVKQSVPLAFLRALQSARGKSRFCWFPSRCHASLFQTNHYR